MSLPETPFHRLQSTLGPTEEQRVRMLKKVRQGMATAHGLRAVRSALEPDDGAQIRIWNRIHEHIAPSRARGFLTHVRTYLTPDTENVIRMGHGLFPALQPVTVPARPMKWVAAFALVLVMARMSPFLFLAPQTTAQSSVLLRPTRGVVTVSIDGLSQPVEREIELLQSIAMRTDDGEATVILHDDGTVRLAAHTSIVLQDLTDRPKKSTSLATLTLVSGTVWVQGLVPDHLRGVSVVTPKGIVTVHGGSMSVTVTDGEVTVESWDRHARFEREKQSDIVLIAGERLVASNNLSVATMPDGAYDRVWPSQNLQRDAVHQRTIAQEQRERIAARAGILPTSRLYSMKRIAEEVDVLFSLDHETVVKKRVAQATTRLNEATTLIAGGQSGATVQLREYQVAMLDIASGSGDTVTKRLVEEGVAENTAQLAAQLPDTDVYAVKRVVLDTSAQLPDAPINASDVEASVIGDAVDALQIAASEGDSEAVQLGLEQLAPYIEHLPTDTDLDSTARKEVISRLSRVAHTLQQDVHHIEGGSGSSALKTVTRVVRSYVPSPSPVPVHLTDEEVDAFVDAILDRVFVYSQYTGQTNQLHLETVRLRGHTDEGRILRALYDELQAYEELNSEGADAPDFRLSVIVRAAIRAVRENKIGTID